MCFNDKKRSAKLEFRLFLLSDIVGIAFAYFLSHYFIFGSFRCAFEHVNLIVFGIYLSIVILFKKGGIYKPLTNSIGKQTLIHIAETIFAFTAVFTLFLHVFSQSDLVQQVILQSIIFLAWVFIVRMMCTSYVQSFFGRNAPRSMQKNILIYGAGIAGMQLSAVLPKNHGYCIKGFIDDDSALKNRMIDRVPIFEAKAIGELVNRLNINEIYLAIPTAPTGRYREILAHVSQFNVEVSTLPKLNKISSGKVSFKDIKKVKIEDLLLRNAVAPDEKLMTKNVSGKTVLVTGAGGSVGSEICRQILKIGAKKILLFDSSEYALYLVLNELKKNRSNNRLDTDIIPILGSVSIDREISYVMSTWRPDIVFHAAAYKHVTMVESNIVAGIRNNVWGTLFTAHAAKANNVENFVLISTDKAVRPTSAMGASKRISEMILQALAFKERQNCSNTRFSMVRFGNVLGSSGSVVPLFQRQINDGGPITLSHNDVTRYFMTMHEAAQLVIQASSLANGGDLFLLDMGEPVKIRSLAEKMIQMSGLKIKDDNNPNGDIEIVVVGLANGEKLYEEMLIRDNPIATSHPRILRAEEDFIDLEELEMGLNSLERALENTDPLLIRAALQKLVTNYSPRINNE